MTSTATVSEFLQTVAGSLAQSTDPLDAWRAVTSSTAVMLGADAAIALATAGNDRMHVAASYRWPVPVPVDAFPIAPDSQARFVLDHDGAQLIDTCTETRFVTSRMLIDAGFVRSCTGRVVVEGAPVGLLGLQFRSKRPFGPEDVALVDGACAMLGAILGQHHRLSLHARLVDHDVLTDLVNRRKLWEILDGAIESGADASLILLDLDGFKAVNDVHGHGIGDLVLQVVARRLRSSVRPLDVVGRLSGDEFAVIAWDIDVSHARGLAERLIGHIEQAISVPHGTVQISASAGIALIQPARSTHEAIRRSDQAMYRAKAEGKGRVCLSLETRADEAAAPPAGPATATRSARGTSLQVVDDAIERIEVEYQPIISASTFRVAGVEALTRGPVGPLRSPADLFHLAETWGRLADLELRSKQVSFTQALPFETRLFVNIDPSALAEPRFLEELECLWQRRHHTIAGLVVELTERHLQSRPGVLIDAVDRFRRLGWQVALDDVGARAASLTALPLVRPDIVKLDVSLINTTNVDHVAATSVALAGYRSGRSIEVIAEGIETHDHLMAAGTLGATHLQGYLFGRPVAADALSRDAAPVAATAPCVRVADRATMIAFSRHLESVAGHPDTIVLASFERADRFHGVTRRQYAALARRCGLIGVVAPEFDRRVVRDIHYGRATPSSDLSGLWLVVVLHPEGGTALTGRPLDRDGDRYEYELTTDRNLVDELASQMLRCL